MLGRWSKLPETVRDRLGLLMFSLPLLLLTAGTPSLMAHDEGYYAAQARWIWETGDWITVSWWGQPLYDRTIGCQWLMALSYGLWGVTEWGARFPSLVGAMLSVLLTYEIGRYWGSMAVARLGSALLMLMVLWVQYARLATQDMLLVAVELLGIWALLRVLQSSPRWGILAGITWGWGFLIKGFMVVLYPMALAPFLLYHYRRWGYGWLGLGVVLGAVPVLLWLGLSVWVYGNIPLAQLFGKLLYLHETNTYDRGWFYYLWNIPVNGAPWVLLSGFGAWRVGRERFGDKVLLWVGYPLMFLVLLSSFRTRTPYYALQLLPFLALLAAVALREERWQKFWRWGALGLGGLLLLAAVIVPIFVPIPEILTYRPLAVMLGGGWLGCLVFKPKGGVWRFLLPAWLAIALSGSMGLWDDYSRDFREQWQRAAIPNAPLDLVLPDRELLGDDHKTWVLLSFYAPHLGRAMVEFPKAQPNIYLWVPPDRVIPEGWQSRARLGNWQLVEGGGLG
ncbi:MAG: glycosyl transferase, partial [Oscillatoriales cyanobacterium SM2_2_1]|nr:glycosyl transferase [Oscillatoriales cyanobacterium SM2_2_1]